MLRLPHKTGGHPNDIVMAIVVGVMVMVCQLGVAAEHHRHQKEDAQEEDDGG